MPLRALPNVQLRACPSRFITPTLACEGLTNGGVIRDPNMGIDTLVALVAGAGGLESRTRRSVVS